MMDIEVKGARIGVKGGLNLSLTMRKLHQLTYFIDRNKISKNLVTPNSDGYSVKCAALANRVLRKRG